jgi:CDGSH-type Zn-finger protein
MQGESAMGKARIIAIKNGPLRACHITHLIMSKGEVTSCPVELFLCRCGASQNKPYCDGSHRKIGFSGDNRNRFIKNKTQAYEGDAITIYDNRNICSHAGICLDDLPTVFSDGSPWINPDGDTVEKIIDICNRCPSGALTYALAEGVRQYGKTEEISWIHVVGAKHQGPYVIRGDVTIEGQVFRKPEVPGKMVLCRCGQSKNKPYCNGDHRFIEDETTHEEK